MDELLKNPIYATGIGLLMYGRQQISQFQAVTPRRKKQVNEADGFGLMSRMRGWFQNSF